MVDWLSLAIPFAYLGVLIGSLATFSSLYRKRKAVKASSLKPWFPPHVQRDVYFSLIHMSSPSEGNEKKKPPVPETVLKAALLRRAAEDIKRLLQLRGQKLALAALLQKGTVGDELWQQFLRAEKELEEEFKDVVSEANAFVPGWGQTIFQSANEMALNTMFRQRVEDIQMTAKQEREWWDRKKASIQEGFMKELEQEGQPRLPAPATGDKEKTPAGSTTGSVAGDKLISDDDTVLVESGGPAVNAGGASGTGGSGGGKKKKKGKK
ncbi:Translocation protein S66 [Ophidiomyces ophidiicola]|uniref:Translocation protein S66 n=1 Tax=Ophidiomyces ophidiicola TaxID=1387563 RepID=A0ACB8V0U2_9EURO|nr:Translocation protein S66 [Ophidiomyces ophidiicola]KAI1946215.1 Translocation protein S66 [Ophidiomyces ophidiicola]KAI2038499.1 Translocation protein S66 [Ophidiomyces ophidiicola]KAI2044019.1 Translocation protein S66 [Ophidiomyces ophidiicola]KAI2074317.1 Translocation protein S66 [Ophidiomyces ophidiicola]